MMDIEEIEQKFDVKIPNPIDSDFKLTIDDNHSYTLVGLDDKGRELFISGGILLVVETKTLG